MEKITEYVQRMSADDLMDIINSLGAYGQYNLRREAKAHGMNTCAYLRRELPGIIYQQQIEAEAGKAVAA